MASKACMEKEQNIQQLKLRTTPQTPLRHLFCCTQTEGNVTTRASSVDIVFKWKGISSKSKILYEIKLHFCKRFVLFIRVCHQYRRQEMSYSFPDFRKTSKKSLGFQIRPKPSQGPPNSLVYSDSPRLIKKHHKHIENWSFWVGKEIELILIHFLYSTHALPVTFSSSLRMYLSSW